MALLRSQAYGTLNFNSDALRCSLKHFFKFLNLAAEITTIDSQEIQVIFKGPSVLVQVALEHLPFFLNKKFSGVEFKVSNIQDDPPAPLSSDLATAKELESEEKVIVFFAELLSVHKHHVADPIAVANAQMFYADKLRLQISTTTPGRSKGVCVQHGNVIHHVNVSSFLTWGSFIDKIRSIEMLQIHYASDDIIVSFVDGEHISIVDDIFALKQGVTYCVTSKVTSCATSKECAEVTTLNGFYDIMLKTDEEMDDSAIDKVKEVFSQQAIQIEDLLETGSLAMTDANLEEFGIKQAGLRIAILSVIRSIWEHRTSQ